MSLKNVTREQRIDALRICTEIFAEELQKLVKEELELDARYPAKGKRKELESWRREIDVCDRREGHCSWALHRLNEELAGLQEVPVWIPAKLEKKVRKENPPKPPPPPPEPVVLAAPSLRKHIKQEVFRFRKLDDWVQFSTADTGWQCICGGISKLSTYVAAHWYDTELTYVCPRCQLAYRFKNGNLSIPEIVYVEQEMFPRCLSGVDYGKNMQVLARYLDRKLLWRSGHTAWAGVGITTYYAGCLFVQNDAISERSQRTLHSVIDLCFDKVAEDSPKKLSRGLLCFYKDKIKQFFGIAGDEIPWKPRKTVVLQPRPAEKK